MATAKAIGHTINTKNGFDLINEGSFVDLRSLKYVDDTSHLNCPICQQPFISPITTVCGHTFCKECIEECFEAKRSAEKGTNKGFCPLDRTTIDASDNNDIFPAPLIVTNMVDDLRVLCLNEERGCNWEGHRWETEHHLFNDCLFTRVYCNGICVAEPEALSTMQPEEVVSGNLTESDENSTEQIEFRCRILTEKRFLQDCDHECVHKMIKCDLCGEQVKKINQQTHLEQDCSQNYAKCDLCENDMIPRKNLEKHLANCLCSGKFTCTANDIGCNWSGDTKPSLENHLQNGNCQLNQIHPFIKKLESRIDLVEEENKSLKKQIHMILDGIVQGKVTNLGYNHQIEEIGNFTRDMDRDQLININYEVERLRSELEEKVNPFIERESNEMNNHQNVINNLVSDNFLVKDELKLQRALLNSIRKQVQFVVFKNRSQNLFTENTYNNGDYEEQGFCPSSRTSSEERLNLKL